MSAHAMRNKRKKGPKSPHALVEGELMAGHRLRENGGGAVEECQKSLSLRSLFV